LALRPLPHFVQIALTLMVAVASALLCRWLRTPIPWMLGPLLGVAACSIFGAPMRSSGYLRNAGQWIIGAALGLYFTAEVGQLVVSLWWAIVLGIFWALALGYGFGLWLQRRSAADLPALSARDLRATTYFAGAIGGASEMALMADRNHARTDLVAASHSLRLVMVVVCLPFGMQWFQSHWGLHVNSSLLPGPRLLLWPGIFYLAMATCAGALFMRAIKRNNPWFMGPLLVAMGLTLSGIQWTAISSEMSNMAQLFIGISLGVRFKREFVRTAPKWLLSVAMGTLGMILASVVFGWALAWGTGLHPATLILGTSPGGIAEMAITAKVLELGAPVVTAFQVCRLIAVLLIVAPLYQWVAVPEQTDRPAVKP
jgi:membrane AbrB-like protein